MASVQQTHADGVPDAAAFAYLRWRTFHDMARLWNLLVFGFTAFLLCILAALIAALAVGASAAAAIAGAGGVADAGIVRFAVKRRREASAEEEKASRAVYEHGDSTMTGTTAYSASTDTSGRGYSTETSSSDWGKARDSGWQPSHPSGW
jgi:uncharacterized membrane protein YraQ (UPF0718 family)